VNEFKKKEGGREIVIIKSVWWRQLCFSLFILICGIFFAFVDFLGIIGGWIGTLSLLIFAFLNLGDQLIGWSRLKIDQDGYDLRTWWTRKKFLHQEIDRFDLQEFLKKKLIVVLLKERSGDYANSEPIPFPCSFGRPVDEIYEVVKSSLDTTPRPLPKRIK